MIRHILAAGVFMIAFGVWPAAGQGGGVVTQGLAATPESTWRIEMTGDAYSLWAADAERREILNEIAMLSGAALGGDSLGGRVSLTVTNASLEELLARLFQNTALVFAYDQTHKRYRIVDIQGFRSGGHIGPTGNNDPQNEDAPHIDGQNGPFSASAKTGNRITAPTQPRIFSSLDSQGRPKYKAGEILVRFKPGVTDDQIRALHTTLGGKSLAWRPKRRLAKVKTPEGLSELAAVREYLASGLVAHAERHALRYPMTVPDDPLYSSQWAHPKMNSEQAWQVTTGDPGVIIAVIDSGVDYTHPDLAPNLYVNDIERNGQNGADDDGNGRVDDIYGYDFADNDANPFDTASDGHGTHVAGIAAAAGNNGLGIAGVAWRSQIMALKVQKDGYTTFETFAVLDALEYARINGARIVNCSYGGEDSSPEERKALADLAAEGVLAVCAAGNAGTGLDADVHPIYPAAYDLENIISVGASTQQDYLASYSYYGAQSVDLLAPGTSIRSTLPAAAHTNASVTLTAPPETTYSAIGLLYAGLTDASGITGELVACGEGYPEDFQENLAGRIALIQRTTPDENFYFSTKVANAAAAGAAGVIIYNNRSQATDPGDTLDTDGGTLGSPGDWLPAVTISKADGEALLSTLPLQVTLIHSVTADSDNYGLLSGTSMAAPQVAGAAALLMSYKPEMTVAEIKAAILDSVDKIPATEGKTVSGGRLNIGHALCLAGAVPGDVNCDAIADLADAIFILQILSAHRHDVCMACLNAGTDPIGDGRITPSDVLSIIQRLAGTRQ